MKNLFVLFSSVLICLELYGKTQVVVGSKTFTESYILSEIISQHLENSGFEVVRKFGLQDRIAFSALKTGGIDLYVEYSGTLAKIELKSKVSMTFGEVVQGMRKLDLDFFAPLGFSNTYALAVKRTFAEGQGVKTIEDLIGKSFRTNFSIGFTERDDGYKNLKNVYGLDLKFKAIEHSLVFQAVSSGAVDLIDVYSTDAKIKRYDLVMLEDSLKAFPSYEAGILSRVGLDPKVAQSLRGLENKISDDLMTDLNGMVEFEGASFCYVANQFLKENGTNHTERDCHEGINYWEIGRQTLETLYLTGVALFAAILLSIPLGICLYRLDIPWLSQPVIALSGILQTIPSLALLFFMVPLFKQTGAFPAMVGLFLYSILPILRNTMTALSSVDRRLIEVGESLGMRPIDILKKVEIPISAPVILAGVRTAAVISVGTATFAAFIGAGGLGEPIVKGLSLNDYGLMLQGVIPASILSVAIELLFEFIERTCFSKVPEKV